MNDPVFADGFQYMNFVDYGCNYDVGLKKKMNDDLEKPIKPIIVDWQYDDGIVDLQIMFTTLCGAVFADSCASKDNIVELFVQDVAHVHGRCICNYTNEFSFAWPGPECLHVIAYFQSASMDHYNTLIDTSITLCIVL